MSARSFAILLTLVASLACQSPPETGAPLPPLASAPGDGEVIPAYPDIRGTWSAVLRGIRGGDAAALPESGDEIQLDYLRLTIEVDVQDGQLFYGTIHNGQQEQSFAGSFREGGREALYITREGRGQLWLDPATPDTIEICGGRGNPSLLLAVCGRMTREPEDAS